MPTSPVYQTDRYRDETEQYPDPPPHHPRGPRRRLFRHADGHVEAQLAGVVPGLG